VSFINEPKKPEPKKVFTGSVFDTQPFEPPFDPAEAARLSRRAYAEETTRPQRRVQEMRATPEDQLKRSAVRAAGDTAIGVLQGAVAIPKGITENIPFDNPLSQFYKDAYEAGEKSKSGYLRSKNVERSALLDSIRKNQGELAATRGAFTTMFSPAGADIVSQGAGSIIPSLGMSVLNLGTKSMVAMNALANAGDAAQQTAARLADMSPEDWSKSGAYQALRDQGLDHRDAVRMLAPLYALPSQTLGGITGAVSGGTGLEGALVKGGARTARARLGRAGAELAGEELETLTPMLAGNITQRLIDDKTGLLQGLGQAAVETAVAAGPGAALSAAVSGERAARRPAPAPAAEPASEPAPTPAATGWEVVSEAPAAAPVTPAPTTPTTIQDQQRAIAELEAAMERPETVAVEAAPAEEKMVSRPAEIEPRRTIQDLAREQEFAGEYDTPEQRLRQSDAFGQDLTGLIKDELESYGRAAIKNRKLTEKAMDMRETWTAASDAATIAFAENDYSKFQPYEGLFKKTAAKLKTEIARQAAAPSVAPEDIFPPSIAAEEMQGVRAPREPEIEAEVERLTRDQEQALAAREKLVKRTEGTSLIKVLKGTLNDGELSELGGRARQVGKNPFLNLKASKGKVGSSMEDRVDSGDLNLFLPEDKRPGHPDYVNSESAEYIREKLRNGEYYTYDTEAAIKIMDRDIEGLERQIQELLSEEEINKEIQYAVNEQRELDQALAEPAAEEEVGAAAERAGEEEGFLKAQTEQELRDQKAKREAAEKKEAEAKREEERKAAAPKAEEFVLTGSERAADQAAARGQMELTPAEEPVAKERPATMYKALPDSGFKRLAKDSERAYRDEGGKAYPTFEKGGARIAMSSNEVLYENENGDVEIGVGEPNETIVRALLVDPATRGQGVASKIMDEITALADEYGITLYLEPTAISDKPVPTEKLKQFYKSKGFEFDLGNSKVMTRNPVKPERSIEEIRQEMLAVRDEKYSLLSKAGKPPAIGTPKRARFDEVQDKLRELIAEYDKAEAREGGQTFESIDPVGQSYTGDETRAPSLKRKVKDLNRQREQGKISEERFVNEVDWAVKQDQNRRRPLTERVRGADYIRQRLLEAKRRGDLSAEAVDMAEYFILQNEDLLDDLGIAVKTPKTGGTGGTYNSYSRIMTLMKEAGNDSTVVHEILHHLERMMPADVQEAIRKEWLKSLLKAQKAAKTREEKFFFAALMNHHLGSGKVKDIDMAGSGDIINDMIKQGLIDGPNAGSYQLAINMLRNGALPMMNYQYASPSEFWAVNGSEIVKGRYKAIKSGVLARLKNWLRELAQRAKGVFGLRSEAPLLKALDSLAKADGKFVSKQMLTTGENFLQVGKNIYGRTPIVAWTTPDETKLDNFIYKMKDKQIDTKRAVDEIERAIGRIDDKWNPYLQEELFHGRTATQTKDFLRDEVRPLLEEMKKEDVSIADLEEYLHNRFAPIRNKNIAEINPLMPDGGSGIDTADAQAYMASLTPEQKAKYDRLASMVYGITANTRQSLVASGLEEKDTVDEWEKSSPDYVPLNREDVEYSTTVGTGTGLGYSVRGPSSRRATGSKRQVVDILANIIMQRERAIVRGEKNRVAVALYALALQNPNPEYWLAVNPDAALSKKKTIEELIDMGLSPADAEGIMKEPTQKVVDPQTGLVTTRINPVLRSADNVLGARVNGKDRFVFFNTQNERGARMAKALKNMDADQLGTVESLVSQITRYFASINTQYNPVFGIYNFLRDLQGGAIQLSGTPLEDSRAEVLSPKNLAGALNGIYQTLRAERKQAQQVMSPWANLWLDFQRSGGQTGYRDMFSRSQERAQALQRELDRMSQGVVRKFGNAIFGWLSDYNETLENAVRLTAYKAALDKGLSKDQAASVAKNLTVNFNRKGQAATRLGAWYAFFNSAVQGTGRLLQTIAKMERPGDISSLRLTKMGNIVIYGGLMVGVAQAMAMAAMGFDEEEPPDFIKDRNLIIPLPGGKYLAWPLPLGYHVIPAIGRILTEWAISGGKDSGKRVAHLTSLLLDAFNPIGNAGLSVQSIAPTLFDPIVALFENKDWTGKKIAKEDFNKLDPTPGYTRAKQNASTIGKGVSYFLNVSSGGDKDKPGVINVTPDQIDYIIGQATGGVGREVMKAIKTAESMKTGEELAPYNVPLIGRFYGDTKAGYAESARFYKNLEEINILENQLQGRQKRKEGGIQEFVKENPTVRLAAAMHQTERNIQQLRKQRDELIKKDAPKERIKAIENRITLQMKALNEKVEKLEKQKR
jgi:GNAT superfamily N-acetyltransferase